MACGCCLLPSRYSLLRSDNLYLPYVVYQYHRQRRSLCCTIMKDWVGALSTIPREHPGVNNLVLAYTCSLYICIFIYRLSAVRCTIMLVWAGLLSTNYMLCLPPSTNYMLCVPDDSMISLLPTSHLPSILPIQIFSLESKYPMSYSCIQMPTAKFRNRLKVSSKFQKQTKTIFEASFPNLRSNLKTVMAHL